MDTQAVKKWLKTAAIAGVGGGLAGALTAAMDPSKYHFPRDFGSGKLLEYFAEGFVVTLGALLIKSPLGQQAMTAYKGTQQQLQASKDSVATAKAELVSATGKVAAAGDDLNKASRPAPKP